jgi:hypothetical protein
MMRPKTRTLGVCLLVLATLGVTGTVWSAHRPQTGPSHPPPGRLCNVADERAAQSCTPPQRPHLCLLVDGKCAGVRKPSLIPAGS